MSKMKPELFQYRTIWDTDFLAIIKNGYVIDIACSDKDSLMYYSDYFFKNSNWIKVIEIQAKDLALYTHWPVHTKEFWDLLEGAGLIIS